MDGWVQIGKRRINLNLAREIDQFEDGSVIVTFPATGNEPTLKLKFEGDEAEGVWRHSRARPVVVVKAGEILDAMETPWTVLGDIRENPPQRPAATPAPAPPPAPAAIEEHAPPVAAGPILAI